MRRVWAVMSRELRAYFDSIIAYVILLAFYSFTTWFTLSSLEAGSQASLRDFFEFLPVGFLFFIPAVAMRLWAEERRLGTIELLMTWPLKTWDIVLGKFFAGLTLIVVALLMTSSYAVYIMQYGEPDLGPLIGGYVAALLLGGAYLALGCFISSLTEHQIVAYVLSVFCAAAFFLVGHPDTLASIPQTKELFGEVINLEPTIEFMEAIGFGSRFASIVRGVLDLGDLSFYTAIIISFLYMNVRAVAWQSVKGETSSSVVTTVLILSFVSLASLFAGVYVPAVLFGMALIGFIYYVRTKTSSVGVNRLLDNTLATILAFIIALQVSLVVDRVNKRADLTEDRVYSLTPYSLKLVGELEDPLEIRCYFSGSLPQALKLRRRKTEDTLSEFVTASKGQISIVYFDPDTDNLAKERAEREGIKAQKVNLLDGKDKRTVERFYGCVMEYQGQKEAFQFMPIASHFESDFSAALRKLMTPRDWNIGLLTSNEKVTSGYRSIFFGLNRRRIDVTRLRMEGLEYGNEIPKNVNVLLLIAPSKLTEREAYEVDQFVMRGGTLLLLADGVSFDSSFKLNPVVTGLENVLASYGFEIKKQVLRDNDENNVFPISVNDGKVEKAGPNPFAVRIPKENLDQEHPITKFLPQMGFGEASPVVVLNKNLKVTELIRSAPTTYSWARKGPMVRVLLNSVERKKTAVVSPNSDRGEIRQPLIALAYEGPLTSFFQGQRPPKPKGAKQESLKDSQRETLGTIEKGRIVIIGDASFHEESRWKIQKRSDLSNVVTSGQKLIMNSIDWIVGDEDLIELRNRGLKDRRLVFPKESNSNQRAFFVYLLTPLLLCLIGLARWIYLFQRSSFLESQLREIVRDNPVSWKPKDKPAQQKKEPDKPDKSPDDPGPSATPEKTEPVKGDIAPEPSESVPTKKAEVKAVSKEEIAKNANDKNQSGKKKKRRRKKK
ncbi:MAG: Gldg family protein [Planctomycetota bacterium]|nr:Gldg family protein [Planctomycetota bacterium]